MSALPPVLLVLNGPAGVGKSTLAARLAAARSASAHVRGDDLKRVTVRAPGSATAGITYRTGGRVCRELLESGYRFVVFDFVFNRAEALELFWASVDTGLAYRGSVITLWAEPATLADRRRGREEPAEYRALMDASHDTLVRRLGDFGTVVQTDDLTPTQVEHQVVELLDGQQPVK